MKKYACKNLSNMFMHMPDFQYLCRLHKYIFGDIYSWAGKIRTVAIHPFREGNGRVQRAFVEILADRAGYEVDFSDVGQDEMIGASAEAFHKEYGLMNELFSRITN